jgi:hypothetical protein
LISKLKNEFKVQEKPILNQVAHKVFDKLSKNIIFSKISLFLKIFLKILLETSFFKSHT